MFSHLPRFERRSSGPRPTTQRLSVFQRLNAIKLGLFQLNKRKGRLQFSPLHISRKQRLTCDCRRARKRASGRSPCSRDGISHSTPAAVGRLSPVDSAAGGGPSFLFAHRSMPLFSRREIAYRNCLQPVTAAGKFCSIYCIRVGIHTALNVVDLWFQMFFESREQFMVVFNRV